MAINYYYFSTVYNFGGTATDDGTGSDWLIMDGTWPGTNMEGYYDCTVYLGHLTPSGGAADGAWAQTTTRSPLYYRTITINGTIENAMGGNGNDYLSGSAANNILMGDSSDVAGARDHLFGNGGEDTLLGMGGDDYLSGGDGNDILFGDNDPYSQDQGNIASGNDALLGDLGDDIMVGGAGNNFIDGGPGKDTADFSGWQDTQYVRYDMTIDLNGNGHAVVYETDLYTGQKTIVEDDTVYCEVIIATAGNDTLKGRDNYSYGLPGQNFLHGGAGNDTITGGYWNDELYGDDGDDTLNDGRCFNQDATTHDYLEGGKGNDTYIIADNPIIFEKFGEGTDTVISYYDFVLPDNVENLIFDAGPFVDTGTGNGQNNELTGNSYDNTLYGLGGNDILSGLAGKDALIGGYGNDKLFGGAGRDVLTGGEEQDSFIFKRTTDSKVGSVNRDVITDFSRVDDIIDLSGIDAKSNIAGNQAFKFIGGTAFTHHAGELRFASGILSADVNGDGLADFQLTIQGQTRLAADDFLL